MENHASNPAGRLWMYFEFLKSGSQTEPIIQLAEKYFGSVGLDARYVAGVAALMALPDEIETMVLKMEHPPMPTHKLLRPLGKVREFFQADALGSNTPKWMQNYIDNGVMSDLETTSHVLDWVVVHKSDIGHDHLRSIRELADEILALALADETLDDNTRRSIIRHAHRITEAVDLYKVKGPEALLDELDRFYGSYYRVPAPTDRTMNEKLRQLAGTIILAVELVAAPATIASAIDYYETTFTVRQITEAPAQGWDDVVYAELEGEDAELTVADSEREHDDGERPPSI